MSSRKLSEFSPGRIILLTLCAGIILGTLLLSLPCAQKIPLSLLDVLFTATSATCVTGLFTVPLHHFTFFGHLIVLILIQLGGLGIITLTLFVIYSFMDIGLSTQLMASQLLEIDSWKNIKQILLFIIAISFLVECIGMLCLLPFFMQTMPFNVAVFMALFHAVSAFCNAGIWLFNQPTISWYGHQAGVLIIMTVLMFIGSFGFITWYEIIRNTRNWWACKRRSFSVHSKIVIYATMWIVGCTTIAIFLLERNTILHAMSYSTQLVSALFYANSFRSAGFVIESVNECALATLILIMVIGFIGSSPASTGNGIKISTFTLFVATIRAAIRGRTDVELWGRHIPIDQVHKATAIVALGIGWIIVSTFVLAITELNFTIGQLLFETVMAFTNVGISSGVTPQLSCWGKCLIIVSMMIGRVGSFSLFIALTFKKHKKVVEFSYPEERIMLG